MTSPALYALRPRCHGSLSARVSLVTDVAHTLGPARPISQPVAKPRCPRYHPYLQVLRPSVCGHDALWQPTLAVA
jgi:hypothetical protein